MRAVRANNPARVVVGGGVSEAGDRLLEPARTALRRSLVGGTHRDVPDIVRAARAATETIRANLAGSTR